MAQLIISDIHADIRALDAIMEIVRDQAFIDRYGKITRIINLGDVVGRGFHPVEVIERLLDCMEETKLVSIMGNHDEAFLLNINIIGDVFLGEKVNSELRGNRRYMRFLKSLPQYMIDENDRILAVHGGPIDPSTIREKICPNDLLYRRTWQRISECGYDYCDASGYYYTPEHALGYVSESLGRGFLTICGHEHLEACYMEVDRKPKSIIDSMIRREEVFSNHRIHIKLMMRQKGVSYLVRMGIAGSGQTLRGNSHFGLIWEQKGADWVGLFSFTAP